MERKRVRRRERGKIVHSRLTVYRKLTAVIGSRPWKRPDLDPFRIESVQELQCLGLVELTGIEPLRSHCVRFHLFAYVRRMVAECCSTASKQKTHLQQRGRRRVFLRSSPTKVSSTREKPQKKRFPCATGSNSGLEFPAWLRLFHALRRAFAQLGNCVRCFERQAGQQAWAENNAKEAR
jgi:hypothetical protein